MCHNHAEGSLCLPSLCLPVLDTMLVVCLLVLATVLVPALALCLPCTCPTLTKCGSVLSLQQVKLHLHASEGSIIIHLKQ